LLPAIVLLVLAGILFLQFGKKRREPPVVRISRISPILNFSTVRVEGVLVSDARQLRNGTSFFTVDDSTGVLAVFWKGAPNHFMPRAGSRVSATGNLRVGAGNDIRLQAHGVELQGQSKRDEAEDTFWLSDVTPEQADEHLTVYGTVSKVWKPRAGSRSPTKIVLEDSSGTLDVVHWLKGAPDVEIGEAVSVSGTVGVYQGQLQLKVWHAEDLHAIKEPGAAAQYLSVGEISIGMEGERVATEGVLGASRSIPGGVIYPLSDSSGTIQVLFWDRKISGEERDALDEGIRIRVEAPVVVYKGVLELVPDDVGGFHLLEAPASPTL
jgi:exonuclease VII large subunit